MKVEVRNNNIDKALRIFKKKSSEIIYEVRSRRFYEKPSVIRHRNRKAAKQRELKRNS